MNQAYQTLPYVQEAWLTRVSLVSLVGLVILRTRKTRHNQALKVLNEPGLPDLTVCAKSLVNQGIPG